MLLKLLVMLIQEMKKTLQDQADIFQDTYFESFQIHELTTMKRFELPIHDILRNFLYLTLDTFLHAFNLHQQYLPYLSDCKNLVF